MPQSPTQLLTNWLATRDCACPACGHNLRGLAEPSCPQCRTSLRLCVGVTEPYLLPWVATFVPVTVGAAAGLLLAGIVIPEGKFATLYLSLANGPLDVPTLAWIFLLEIPLAVVLLVSRRRFIRQSRSLQRTLAITANIINWLGLGLLAVTIR
jgi:hypothetical protein